MFLDEPNSRVIGHIIEGVFDGTIYTGSKGTYHVERAHKFFPNTPDFHSIIYHQDHVRGPSNPASCGAKGRLMEELEKKAANAVPLNDQSLLYGEDAGSRLKRQTLNGNRFRFCPVRVVADHLFLENVAGGNMVNAMSEIVTLISTVQEIYRNTDFNGDGISDSIQPVIIKLEIFDPGEPGYRYGAASIEVKDFLDLWSQEDQSMYCLALLLTYRDFANGVMGLAWVAQPPGGNRGGICEPVLRFQAGQRSLNTAIVTFLNFGQIQPRSISTITIAHEFGHNFGSPVSHTHYSLGNIISVLYFALPPSSTSHTSLSPYLLHLPPSLPPHLPSFLPPSLTSSLLTFPPLLPPCPPSPPTSPPLPSSPHSHLPSH